MKNLYLLPIFIILISITPLFAFGIANTPWIPPTNAFDKVHSSNGTIYSTNYSMPLTINGANGVIVTSNNKTHTLTITGSGSVGTNQGTYNKTLANNVLVNSLGNRINLINGSNNPVTVINDPTRNQVNITISSNSGSGSITGSQNIGKGTNSQGVLASPTATTIRGKNVTSLRTDLITISSSNTTDINLSSTFKSNSITCTNQFFSAFSNTTGLYTCSTPLNTAQIGNADNGESLFSSRSNATKNLLMTIRNSSAYLLWNHNTTSITPSFQFKVNTLSCPANSAFISYNNSTGLLTCQAFGSGSGTIIGSQNVGKGTGSVGVLSTASSTIIKGRNFTGTSPIVISKTNDTDVAVSCPTCGTLSTAITSINSQTGPAVNIVGTKGNITITNSTNQIKINTGYFIPLLNGNQTFTKNNTFAKNLNLTSSLTMNVGQTLFFDGGSGATKISSGSNTFTYFAGGSQVSQLTNLKVTMNKPFLMAQSGESTTRVNGAPEYTFNAGGSGEADLFGDTGFSHVLHIYSKGVNSGGNLLGHLQMILGNDTVIGTGANMTTSATDGYLYIPVTKGAQTGTPTAFTGSVPEYFDGTSNRNCFYNNGWQCQGNNAINFTSSSNKTGTSSLVQAGVMLGDGVTLTPLVTGRAEVIVSGYATQNTGTDGCSVALRWGTLGPPGNGAAATGTLVGNNIKATMSATTTKVPFSITAQITGLTLGTKIWMELTERADTGGTCTLFNVMFSAKEI